MRAISSCRDDLDLDLGARDFQKLIVLVNPLHEIDKNTIGSDPVLTVHYNLMSHNRWVNNHFINKPFGVQWNYLIRIWSSMEEMKIGAS